MPSPVREKILFISPVIPRPDMNSGDLRLCSLLEMLAQKYRITFVATEYRDGDDSYISHLEKNGVVVHAAKFSLWKLLKTEQFKVAILEFYYIAGFYLDRIRILQPECRVVVDTVDVHFLRLKQKYDLTNDNADLIKFEETKRRELLVYRKADSVLTVTRDDAAALLEESSNIRCEVVPNIHGICLGGAPPEADTLLFVGGFSHSPNADAVQYFCDEILPLIRISKPGVIFTVVGSNPPDKIRNLASEKVKVTGYVPDTTPYLHRSCLSVAPLRYGAGMKGKIGEAMAHGVPVVTTPVGAQGMGLADRINVMIADSPQAFAGAVLELLNDRDLRESIRNNAVRIINDNFTPEQVAKSMLAALDRICKKPAKRMMLHEKVVFLYGYITEQVKARLLSSVPQRDQETLCQRSLS